MAKTKTTEWKQQVRGRAFPELNKVRNMLTNGASGLMESLRCEAENQQSLNHSLLSGGLANLEPSTFLSLRLLGKKVHVMLRPRL